MPVQPRLISLLWHRDRYRSAAALGFVDATVEICAQVTAELDGVLRPSIVAPDQRDRQPASPPVSAAATVRP
jgi:hypothetical protein